MKKNVQILLAVLLILPAFLHGQSVSGIVTDSDGPVIGATIAVGATGTITDIDGSYSLSLTPGNHTLEISYTGYGTQVVDVNLSAGENKTVDVILQLGVSLSDVIITGTRTAPRSSTDTPLPIDVVSAKDLMSTGQNTFDKALTYKIPSFNSVNTPVNDATSLLDPYEIRNMGPSRTLILIDGKRKNNSALLYTQTSPGRGETGADISAIPQDAIERVEILRDGASAQYGSDAIAGVMNIILKKNAKHGSVTFTGGLTSEGDGETFGISINNGTTLADNGFVNYTIDLSKREQANRPGTVSAEGEAGDFGASLSDVNAFLSKYPDAGNINGSPETTAAKFLVNTGYDLSETTKVYANAAYVYKKVNSFANYRTPYWRTQADFPYLADFFPNGDNGEYIGYVPTFEGDLNDYNGTIGFRSTKNDWNFDASFTTGGNRQTYRVDNSHNRNTVLSPPTYLGDLNGNGTVDADEIQQGVNLYRENSQISFDPGGTQFSHYVGNIDISRVLSDQISIGFGSEFRTETFEVIPGELSSYDGGGADSFSGNDPANSGKFNRYNIGGYADVAFDVTDNFLLNGTIRFENYSDFGDAFVWKLSSRYKLADDKITLRGSISTGFRAPTLHQIYTQKAQYSFVPGQGIQVGGLINNVSREARLLGLPKLDAEESTNITVGLGIRPDNNWSFTFDYYNIKVTDRIILSSEISKTDAGGTSLDAILTANNLSDLSFFVNALDTKTSGIDVVANYRGLELGSGNVAFSLSGNYTIQNERDGEVNNPTLVEQSGQSVSNATQEALFFTSRPKYKAILGIAYSGGKFGASLNNTLFGTTEFRQQGIATSVENSQFIYTEFSPKVVTDLGLSYKLTEKTTVALNVNNLLNVLPSWSFKADEGTGGETLLNDAAYIETTSNAITFNQRYSQMTYDGYHFSQLGTVFNLTVNVQF